MNRFTVQNGFYRCWALLRQNPLFSSIYIVGTALSVALVMVMFILFYVKFAPIYPEGNRNRTLVLKYVQATSLTGDNYWGGGVSPRISQDILRDLPHLEDYALTYEGYAGFDEWAALTKQAVPMRVLPKYVNDGFWRVFTFHFLSGKPFSKEEVESAMPIAVISERLARRLFGTDEAAGRQFFFNGQEMKVTGVVREVSWATPATAADVWLPMNRHEEALEMRTGKQLLGNLLLYMTAPTASDKEALRQEVNDAFRRYNTSCKEIKYEIFGQPDDYWKSCFRVSHEMDIESALRPFVYFLLALLLIPALNLGGIVASRMDNRMGELGIRKAYGASNGWLLRQILKENLLFTSLGSLLGLLLSFLCIRLSSDWLMTLLDGDISVYIPAPEFTFGMLFQPAVFGAAVFFCLLLNLLSALLPALLSLRKSVVELLHQKR